MIFEQAAISLLEKAGDVMHKVMSPASLQKVNALCLGTSPEQYHPNRHEPLYLHNQDRLKHLYVCGGSGMGKSNLLFNLIRLDIIQRNGFGLIDAHGDLISQILNLIALLRQTGTLAKSDLKRLVLIDPSQSEYVVGFNPLETDSSSTAYSQVSEMMSVFKKIWKDVSWGARMDELLRATLYTLAENGLTLLEARPLLTNRITRLNLTRNLKNQEIKDYWQHRFETLSDKMQAVYREPVLNKISIFLSDPAVRLILGQKKSAVKLRKAMDEGKWVLINLSKGKLKDNANLLGGLFVINLYQSSLSRTNIPADRRRPFYLYIDEFQNFAGDGFVDILSESRKYGLSLTLANQNLAQLDRDLLSSIFANASTHIYFRLSPSDARNVASEFGHQEGQLLQNQLINLKVGEAVVRMKGYSARLLKTFYEAQKPAGESSVWKVIETSLKTYGVPKRELEAEHIKDEDNKISSSPVVTSSKPIQKIEPKPNPSLTPQFKLPDGMVEGE